MATVIEPGDFSLRGMNTLKRVLAVFPLSYL